MSDPFFLELHGQTVLATHLPLLLLELMPKLYQVNTCC